MVVKNIKIENFRNIEKLELEPCEKVNIIYGKNAQGKTNILEAIWLFSGAKSFRTIKEQEFIRISAPFFRNEMVFDDGERENNAILRLSDKKEVMLNGVKKKTSASLAGKFLAVPFVPAHLSFITGSPENRRKFIDGIICQLKPSYISVLHKYHKILLHRNNLLKNLYGNAELYGVLDAYDNELADCAKIISEERVRYLEELSVIASEFYSGISGGKETMRTVYVPSVSGEISKENILNALKINRNEDIRTGVTGVGPHRDDISVEINALSAKKYASQGQQRSIVLTLKLAEGELIYKKSGKKPVFLLDDVMSELDEDRQDFILNHVKDNQVFITCCDISSVLRLFSGKIFGISEGKISEEKSK